MKKLILIFTLSAFIAVSSTSCVRIGVTKKDNGKHKGWFKNRHNPHHPNSNNPGHNKKDNPGNKKKFYRVNLW